MKTSILTLILSGISTFLFAQDPPQNVLTTFQNKFTNAKKINWSREDASEWEAEFALNDQKMSASFDSSGKWLETETCINKKDLPEAVKTTLDKQYADYKLRKIESIQLPSFDGYEIALKRGNVKLEVLADLLGNFTEKHE